jgi:hypothetical protein
MKYWGGAFLRSVMEKMFDERIRLLKVALSEREKLLSEIESQKVQTERDIQAIHGAIQEAGYWKSTLSKPDVVISDDNIQKKLITKEKSDESK